MTPEFDYSDAFQPYVGYDKFEYDIKLKNGNIIPNCYPNAGKFNSLNTNKDYDETIVDEIRYANEPQTYLNIGVSDIKPVINYEDIAVSPLEQASYIIEAPQLPDWHWGGNSGWGYVAPPFKRSEPKIGRNDPCSCGSGKKFKNCCK